jgi:hypothetical protein
MPEMCVSFLGIFALHTHIARWLGWKSIELNNHLMYAQYKRHNKQPLIAFNIALHVHVGNSFSSKTSAQKKMMSLTSSGEWKRAQVDSISSTTTWEKSFARKKAKIESSFFIFSLHSYSFKNEFKMKFFLNFCPLCLCTNINIIHVNVFFRNSKGISTCLDGLKAYYVSLRSDNCL